MNKQSIEKALKTLRENSKERKFKQSFDLVVTLKDINLKNNDEQVDFFATYSHSTGKDVKVAALVGPELADKAEGVFDFVIHQRDFDKYKDKKEIKKLATTYDFFIAQADIMPKVATTFGRALGPRGKMPNPKLGSIVPAKGQVEPLYAKLKRTVRVSAKKSPMAQVKVGNESMKDEELVDNILLVYNQLVHHLPKEAGNIKTVMLKLTMSKPVKVN